MSYIIVTDSSCNLSNEQISRFNLRVLSLKYYIGDKECESYVKDKEVDFKSFYSLARKKEPLSTSLASPDVCNEVFSEILESGEDLLYIGFSSALSGTYQVAHNCLEELKTKYPDRKIFDIDSKAASLGEGLLVYYAVMKKNEGQTIEQIYNWIEENKLHLCHWFTVDDLFFLKRGGRVSGAAAVIGTVLSIKPVMHVDDEGRLIVIGKAIGRRRSIDSLVEKMKATVIEPENQTIFISHGDCIDDAIYLAEKVKKELNVKDVFINYVDTVIGCHSGPGTLALFFLGTHR